MKTNYLISNRFKLPGAILFITGLVLGIILFLNDYETDILNVEVLSIYNEDSLFGKKGFFKIIENSIADEFICLMIIAGGMLWAFSKERVEDEFIYKLRKDSWIWAIIVNYTILIFAILLVYGLSFFDVLIFNMFTPLVFFILRFNFLKIRYRSHEE